MIRHLLLLLTLGFALHGASQTLRASVSKDSILIGEIVEIKFRITTLKSDSIAMINTDDLNVNIQSPQSKLQTSRGLLELVEDYFDTNYVKGNKRYWEHSFKATIYDSGVVTLANRVVMLNDSTSYFPEVSFSVFLVDPIDSLEMYDIAENYAEVPEASPLLIRYLKNYWWLVLLIVLVVIGYIYWKRRKPKFELPEKRVSLRDRTIKAIEALEEAKMWERNELKTHFTELSFILRSYLAARYDLDLLECTTTQSKLLLKEKGLNSDTIDVIVRILYQSDLVKFAKSKPDLTEILKTAVLAKQIVAETSPLDFEKIDD